MRVPLALRQCGKEVSHMGTRKITRSAVTGRIVKPSEAKKHPKTTVTETVKTPPKKKK
jgi:hypothetical protein